MSNETILWIIFGIVIVVMLVLDLGMFHRKSRVIKLKEAVAWGAIWFFLALLFMGLVFLRRGPHSALEFLTGYVVEESLSVDNLFVFLMIFAYFAVPSQHQHKVLFWGILGAVLLRAVFIVVGVALVQRFFWMFYVLGVILIVSGVKMATEKGKKIEPEKNPVLKMFRRWMPVTSTYDGSRFFVRQDGRLLATPLCVVLIVVETTDIIFAMDSIPAVLAITTDPFIVYTSNVFAVLGLRTMYFALAGAMHFFHHLHHGVSAILIFVGLKMILAKFIQIPIGIALGVVAAILAFSIVASLIWPQKAVHDLTLE